MHPDTPPPAPSPGAGGPAPLFLPVASSWAGKVACTVCGARGYPGGRWQEIHRRGHGPCPSCGLLYTLRKNLTPRIHTRCPRRPQ